MQTHLIVGAGAAGAVLAARLSERPRNRVLLFEAGADYLNEQLTPADLLDSRNTPGLEHDWGYTAVPVDGRTIPYLRGKVIGGCSAINAAAAQWPRRADLGEWSRRGNDLWTFEQVAPFLARLEDDPDGVGDHHGRGGPLPISRYPACEWIPIQRAFYRAAVETGLPEVLDHNDLVSCGVGPWPMNRSGRVRVSAALSHLSRARARSNLTVQPHSLIDRVEIRDGRATGVRLADGRLVEADCITLCAGAIGSPAVLLRSGIGPVADLERLGIEPQLEAAVGTRLWDHASVPIRLVPLTGECVPGRDPRFQVVGRYTATGSSLPEDMQIVMVSHLDLRPFPVLMQEAGAPVVATLRASLMRPLGHGQLTLVDRDPAVSPAIRLGYCTEAEDQRRLVEGVRRAWALLHTKAMSASFARVAGLSAEIVGDEAALQRYVRASVGSYSHASGTVPMGPAHDPGAVVDQQFRVKGIDNLRVVDASVFPRIPGVVPNLTVLMLAERAAEWLG